MKRDRTKYYLPASIVIGGIFVSAAILYGFGLDSLSKIAGIVAALSLLVALREYFYKREMDKANAVADQISFFREKVLAKDDELLELVVAKDPKYIFRRVKLDIPTLKHVRDKYFDDSKEQAELARDNKILRTQGALLNMLEELALRIRNSETYHHPSLQSIKSAFIVAVEINATVLLLQREILSGNLIYSETLNLYQLWKDDVDRTPPQERLDKFLSHQ